MSLMFNIFPIIFLLFFGLFFAVFIFVIVSNVRRESHNNHSPRITVPATVVAKRDHRSYNRNHHYTSYHVTFQFESGDRLELTVPGGEFGLLCEGDRGTLTFQGTRYLSFEREL